MVAQAAQAELGLQVVDLARRRSVQRVVEVDPVQARALFERRAVAGRAHRGAGIVDLGRRRSETSRRTCRAWETAAGPAARRAAALHDQPGLFVRLGGGALLQRGKIILAHFQDAGHQLEHGAQTRALAGGRRPPARAPTRATARRCRRRPAMPQRQHHRVEAHRPLDEVVEPLRR